MPESDRKRDNLAARLTLISHAAIYSQRRAAFPLDEPPDEREIAKIAALGWHIPRAQRVCAAPERRALQTAQALGLTAAVATELRDCDYGAWRGQEFDHVQAHSPEAIRSWLTDPAAAPHGGESILSLIDRVGRWLDEQSDGGHTSAGSHTIAVTHPAIIRSAIVHTLHALPQTFWRIDIAPLSQTDLRFNGTVWTLRSAGCPLLRLAEEVTESDIS